MLKMAEKVKLRGEKYVGVRFQEEVLNKKQHVWRFPRRLTQPYSRMKFSAAKEKDGGKIRSVKGN